jgi:hypothetical protein
VNEYELANFSDARPVVTNGQLVEVDGQVYRAEVITPLRLMLHRDLETETLSGPGMMTLGSPPCYRVRLHPLAEERKQD